MLLPLIEWHNQPILSGSQYASDPAAVRALTDIWSAADLQDEWRRDNLRRAYALLATNIDQEIYLPDRYSRFGYRPARSKERWSHFLWLYFPHHVDTLKVEDLSAV